MGDNARGRKPNDTMGSGEGDRMVKKKKSIFRSLSMSRKSRPATPEIVMSPPMPSPVPSAPSPAMSGSRPPRVVSTSSIGPEPESGNLKDWNPQPSQDLDKNISRVKGSEENGDSTSTQNFSWHPRNRSTTINSLEEPKTYRDTLLPPPPAPPTREQERQRELGKKQRELHHQQSHGAFHRPPDTKENKWPERGSSQWNTQRPHTAAPDAKSVRDMPNFSGPRGTRLYVNEEKVQRAEVEGVSSKPVRQEELRTSGTSQYSNDSARHSSTFTKMSFVSDSNTDINDQDFGKDEMTVDDAIDLYACGFEDDQTSSQHTPQRTPQQTPHTSQQIPSTAQMRPISGPTLPTSQQAMLTSQQPGPSSSHQTPTTQQTPAFPTSPTSPITPTSPTSTASRQSTKSLQAPLVPHQTSRLPASNSGTRKSVRQTQFFSHVNVETRSTQLAQAMNDPLTAGPMPKSRRANQPTSMAIFGGEVFKSLDSGAPGLLQPTDTHDQYGFRKVSRDITAIQHHEWYNSYVQMQTRRNSKWVEMMIDAGLSTRDPEVFPAKSAKMQRYIRKGVPPAWRGAVWWHYAGGPELLQKSPDLYADLLTEIQKGKLSEGDKESIERDLHRTFPDNVHFKPENSPGGPNTGEETPLMSSLRRLLSAFAIHHPRIGYCQSLNFLAGLLLLFMTEEKAFWMLHIITTRLLPGTHETSLEGANVDLWVLMLALKDALPDVWTKVGGESGKTPSKLPPISLCTTSWFMSLFIGTLPTETTLRVWDALFYDGSVTIFRIAIGVFRLGEAEIKAVNDQMETFQVVQTLPRKMLDVGALMEMSYRRNAVATSWVEKKRKERKQFYAEERLAERARKQDKETDGPDVRTFQQPAAAADDDRVGRPELSRSKSMGAWAKRSLSMKRSKSAKAPLKRSATAKYNMV